MVSEEYLLTLERKVFCHLIAQPKDARAHPGHIAHPSPVRHVCAESLVLQWEGTHPVA